MARKSREEKLRELVAFDRVFINQGEVVAGIDEAGRGPLAGNVVAACVIMPQDEWILWVDDSKKLSPKRREEIFYEIQKKALYIGTGEVSPREIDEINILVATKKAMAKAAENAPASFFLIDGRDGLYLPKEQAVIGGDGFSYSIAAASIVAKVTRDHQLIALDEQYPQYGFAKHKGYGTKEHIEAIKKYGPCPAHRQSFLRNILKEA